MKKDYSKFRVDRVGPVCYYRQMLIDNSFCAKCGSSTVDSNSFKRDAPDTHDKSIEITTFTCRRCGDHWEQRTPLTHVVD